MPTPTDATAAAATFLCKSISHLVDIPGDGHRSGAGLFCSQGGETVNKLSWHDVPIPIAIGLIPDDVSAAG